MKQDKSQMMEMTKRMILGQLVVLILTIGVHRSLLASATNPASAGEKERVAILALAPYTVGGGQTNPVWNGGAAVIPAVRLAVDRINNRTDVLPGYHIQLLEGNSGCQLGPRSTYSFVSNTFHDGSELRTSSQVVGVIGPACSESAVLLGTLGAKDGISLIQISPSATSPLLTDTVKYRNTFRTLSTALQHTGALTQLMTLNSWENIAVLHDKTRIYFRLTSEKFIAEHLLEIGFDSEIDHTFYPLKNIVAHYKVVVLIAGSKLAREVICAAYNHQPQLIYPVYQWIIVDKSKHQFIDNTHFIYNGIFYNCSSAVMQRAIEGALFTTYRLLSREDKEQPTDVDITFAQYEQLYKVYLNNHLKELAKLRRDTLYEANAGEYAVSYYDATWALVLALNASFFKPSKKPLLSYKHGHPEITDAIKSHLIQLEFEGLMGRIAFRETQDSSTPLNIHQCIYQW